LVCWPQVEGWWRVVVGVLGGSCLLCRVCRVVMG